jgi:2-phosphosulfolactate phosphatase
MSRDLDQGQFSVRMEWGLPGATEVGLDADYAVIVDVLSFTTAVSVALDQHIEVFPCPWRDHAAGEFARRHDAVLAVGRADAESPDQSLVDAGSPRQSTADAESPDQSKLVPVSLSPLSIRTAGAIGRIVLPSPNGSALASALQAHRREPGKARPRILAACLRNRAAVASWLAQRPDPPDRRKIFAVIAAGERWPDNSLRPAAEDLWGAGALVAALASLGITGLSPEARSAAAAWRAIEPALGPALATCGSGAELTAAGFGADVAIAGEVDVSKSVPLLSGDRFTDASQNPDNPDLIDTAATMRREATMSARVMAGHTRMNRQRARA